MRYKHGLTLLYAVLPSTLFMLILVVAMLGTSRMLETYDLKVVRNATHAKSVSFARTPIVELGAARYAVLGVRYHTDPRKCVVLLRNLASNQVVSVRKGQMLQDGSKLSQITLSQLIFSKDSQMVIVGLPERKTSRTRSRI